MRKDGEEMPRKDACDQVVKQYYESIYRYCLQLLNNDTDAANDCCQEVFAIMIRKQAELDFCQNIRGWLYACTDRIIRNYKKQEAQRSAWIETDPELLQQTTTVPFEPAGDDAFASLDETEYELLKSYYGAAYGTRTALAKQLGMTLTQLYKKIHSIRDKIKHDI